MADNNLTSKITDIIIQQTVNQKIPTVVFLSNVDKGTLVKNLFWTLKSGNKDESSFTQKDWNEVAEIMEQLSSIPLLLKETTDANYIKTETQTFISGMDGRTGLVIIDSKKNIFTPDKFTPFTEKGNVSIMIIRE